MDINFWVLPVCAVLSMILGMLWYGPLFGKIWMEGMGWTKSDIEHAQKTVKMGPMFLQQFVISMIMAYVLSVVFWAFGKATVPPMSPLMMAVNGAFWNWLGFVVPVKFSQKLWEGKKFKYVALDLAYWLVLLFVMSLVIAYWK